ncbi:MAG TPA: hypothetical protein VJL54_05495 [Nitrososphaera sp.]|jgi:hypothetical protein|nr:hypothetical protein [Nitrososphaera sp.]
MNKPALMALGTMAALFTVLGVGSVQQTFAQYPGGTGGEPITPEMLEKCELYNIVPCTQNGILAKERLIAAQGNPSTGSGTPMLSTETGQMAVFIGVLGAIFGGVAAAFFLKGRGSKPVAT